MKANEILQALNLSKSKTTTNFCSKLANLFSFMKMVINDFIRYEISEPVYTISQAGKLLEFIEVERDYRESMLSHYKYNDKQMKALAMEENETRCELRRIIDLLWKKRKNKNNSILESERDSLIVQAGNLEQTISLLLDIEKIRLQGLKVDISKMRKELNLFTGQKISLSLATGSYSFYLPINNEFYRQIMLLMGIDTILEKPDIKPLQTILVDSEIFKTLDKAARFVSTDNLRPVMQHICLAFENNTAEVIATDAHRLYQSAKFESSEAKRIELVISVKDAKEISKMTFYPLETAEINLLSENRIMIEGKTFNLFTESKYPDYRCVIPVYENYMEFNRADMIAGVKTVMPYSNKSTSQVNFYLNGNIQLSAQDVDFSFESSTRMNYKSKSFPDTDIAFSGSLLTNSLSIFKDENIKMFSDGIPTRAAIFTNDTEMVLLMPLMMNDSGYNY